jgi:hypothetical protein
MWARLEPSILSGAPPKGRHCHAAATYGDKIIYFGGTDGKERYNDVYVFDTGSFYRCRPQFLWFETTIFVSRSSIIIYMFASNLSHKFLTFLS